MAAVWVLLGKTRYPAKLLETFAGKSWGTDIPFDLTIDVLPELLRDPDSHLQHLAAEGPQDVAGFEDIANSVRHEICAKHSKQDPIVLARLLRHLQQID